MVRDAAAQQPARRATAERLRVAKSSAPGAGLVLPRPTYMAFSKKLNLLLHYFKIEKTSIEK